MDVLKRKHKGNAEKQREKKKKLLAVEALKCKSLDVMFKNKKNIDVNDSEQQLQITNNSTSTDNILNSDTEITVLKSDIEIIKSNFLPEIHNTISSSNNFDNDWFKKPNQNELQIFFEKHPIQPQFDNINCTKLYKRKDNIIRNWLSFNYTKNSFFCSVCLAFCKDIDDDKNSRFIKYGLQKDSKHLFQRVDEHEISKNHSENVESFMLLKNKLSIKHLIYGEMVSQRQLEIKNRREILFRVIETIKLIGKRGLSYRGTDNSEAAYNLFNETIDHGNFLELLIFLSKFDLLLKNHLKDSCEKSELSRKARSKSDLLSKGRGNFETFISKTTVNNIIRIISKLIKNKISLEVSEADFFSLQIDTTQDINVRDQCSVVIRYIRQNKVHERLIALIDCESTKGKAMTDYVCEILKIMNIDISKCIGTSTDGAANMQGQYSGFSSWLNKEVGGDLLNVWCYAHILNLVMTDVTENNHFSINLFGILNTCSTFFKESFIRMQTLRNYSTKKLTSIGKTRWWSKDTALTKIFGLYNYSNTKSDYINDIETNESEYVDVDFCVYVELIMALEEMAYSPEFNSSTRFNAKTILEKLITYETVLTGKMYSRIFKFTTPLSKYLQTNGMDVVQAHRMVLQTIEELKKIARDSQSIFEVTDKFIECANKKLKDKKSEIYVEDDFPIVRTKKLRVLNGEIGQQLITECPKKKFEIEVYNIVFDTVITSFERRFNISSKLMADLACLHPDRFEEIQYLTNDPLERLSKYLIKFDNTISSSELCLQLKDFAKKWDSLKLTLDDEYSKIESDEVNCLLIIFILMFLLNNILTNVIIPNKFNLFILGYSE